MTSRRLRIFAAALGLCLLISAMLNLVLYQRALLYYRQINALCLDPLGLVERPPASDPIAGNSVVVFWGDSRAAKWPVPDADGLTFANAGVSAQTSEQALLRYDAHVAPLGANTVIIQVGINDLKAIPLLPERHDEIVARCVANINHMAQLASDGGAMVILTTIFPAGRVGVLRNAVWSSDVDAAIVDVNAAIRAMAAENVLVLDAYAILATSAGKLDPAYALDTLHLNAAGYRRLNSELTPMLRVIE